MRKPSGRLPVDRASERPESPSTAQKGLSTEGLHVPPVDPVKQFDALRAVTKFNEVQKETIPETGLVVFMLGLAEPLRTPKGLPAVPKDFVCPTCNAPMHNSCISETGRDPRPHAARSRLANQPITEKESLTNG